jgi:hypothetical protein
MMKIKLCTVLTFLFFFYFFVASDLFIENESSLCSIYVLRNNVIHSSCFYGFDVLHNYICFTLINTYI